ncbi:probable YjeF-related protein [Psychrobacter arcticus 273-4]|uniref:ADP-dependent (S)-NAD(P)H-hydrate dehydratase n=1 Tax=Psychrobacter arcticus (strain DSM 17307 / VKM B-2377 / 273-4) TaxID=259536 RepID=Q4FUC0_PSYA2|nr:NAD(P)H-hydrate dehydratase [Psychrobacter arcticus]AAZ18388.1 probable YjeF-related protein [Psychrobacter arcticus 273-4]
MDVQTNLFSKNTMPIALYSSEQLYAMEQAWFAQGNGSFGLMQQAAWQMAQHIESLYEKKCLNKQLTKQGITSRFNTSQRRASIWVGIGSNGGDGWLIAYYLQQRGWQVQVIAVGFEKQDFVVKGNLEISADENKKSITAAARALQLALSVDCEYQCFKSSDNNTNDTSVRALQANVYIDALFGIGFNRAPNNMYQQAICAFNAAAENAQALVIAVDIPSGLVASTGQVFERIAIVADTTLCLIARKFGLHTKDGLDYSGAVIDIPLIPYQVNNEKLIPVATLITSAHSLKPRRQNSYKGSYGHVLVIGGNRIEGSQGMGGAAILSASSAMATGAGKITVACHEVFHGALLTSLPDAMTIDLHDKDGINRLIGQASVIAIGMGLGRDEKAKIVFISCIEAAIAVGKPIIIDADGLYHLASLHSKNHKLIAELKTHSATHQVCLTPHSGEAARLLNKKINEIENDRLAAIKQCAAIYGGDWVLKGAGSLVLEQQSGQAHIYVCGVGNAGMATAGMGDVLAGVIAGLLAQEDLKHELRSLHQAVLIHGLTGDILVNQTSSNDDNSLLVGQRGLQAQDMPAAIRHVMQLITDSL